MNKKRAGFAMIMVVLLCAMMSVNTFAGNKTGWVNKGNKWFYYNKDGARHKGWLRIGKKTYYLDQKTGKRLTGTYRIRGKSYEFNEKGVLKKTMPSAAWKKDSKGRWYDRGNGTYPKNCWALIQGKKYLFDQNGYAVTGWKKTNQIWYYFSKGGAMAAKKWVKSGNFYYYLGSDGKMKTNQWIGNRYVNENGAWLENYRDDTRTSKKKTGWVGYGSIWRYFKNAKAVTGWQQIRDAKGKKQWYYFKKDTYMETGFFFDGKDYYFLDTRPDMIGIMAAGWMKINGNYYYFFPSGKMVRNMKLSAGAKEYNFDENGICTNFNK